MLPVTTFLPRLWNLRSLQSEGVLWVQALNWDSGSLLSHRLALWHEPVIQTLHIKPQCPLGSAGRFKRPLIFIHKIKIHCFFHQLVILSVENLNSSEQKIVYYQPGGIQDGLAFLFFFFFLTWCLFLSTTSMHTNNHFEEAKVLQNGDADLSKAHKYGTESMVFKHRQGCSSVLHVCSSVPHFCFGKGGLIPSPSSPAISSWFHSLFFLHCSSSPQLLAVESVLLTTLYHHRQALDCKANWCNYKPHRKHYGNFSGLSFQLF